MELRSRHVDAPPARDAPSVEAVDRPERRGADTRTVRDDSHGYDADAEFKRGVPRPPGRAQSDAETHAQPRGQARDIRSRRSGDERLELHHDGLRPERHDFRQADSPDTPRVVVEQPTIKDPLFKNSPDRYADVLNRPDADPVPLFEGPPTREQTAQGWARDCGVIAALGAVAGHQPDNIRSRIRELPDGNFLVGLEGARLTETGAAPTGSRLELLVTPELPVQDSNPDEPACASTESGTAWCAVMEKALAGIDGAWEVSRQMAWADAWSDICADTVHLAPERQRSGMMPDGYYRLNQGTDPWETAEILTHLTGQVSEVREFPGGADEWKINRVIRDRLNAGKPVLVGSREREFAAEQLPHDLYPKHAYEVTAVTD